ncbi:extracellular solute-binding protein [Puniceibacterium sediminis]|uniref:Spermidine/putrescine transport system substrate-binding protein n=1 Tax=Puniceibacterium sediminis TaxID=1608407 RepID=A0A238UTG3_9RHOB|nr:extracellular solute-binding protein [Puniceibacterium sediminis]SNR24589.1 spermidine/putrescine transport system substrate-binding protein [Puniceibacterium sediminis]
MKTTTRLLAVLAGTTLLTQAAAAQELNALVWCDHTDDALIKPFEDKFGVKVNLKEYEGTGAALSLIEQSQPGDWDVLVVDGIDVPRVVSAGILGPLPVGDLPYDSLFPEMVMEENHVIDGQTYAISEKFGYNTVSFNSAAVSAEDLSDMTALWSDNAPGSMAVYDYYVPVMGMVAMGLGIPTADITLDDLPAIEAALMKLKDNASSVGEVVSSQTAIATGEVDILFGGGEWVTAGLTGDLPDLDWLIPEQGAVRWSQSIGVFADSKQPDLAVEFVKHVLSPQGQAALATSSCYWAMPANRMAGAMMTDEQKAALRWDQQVDYLNKADLYPTPDADLDAAMQDVWTRFLAH